ncbi:hypothetical protein V1477_011469 [Vespula maculifrons]|uniref:Uncharacterized protein n=1 Tax=Vespula maculifrons TaxID=7453 RepID=A0ABD2BZA0_VESMC
MESNNCSNNLEKLGSFCSDCKLILKSIYSLGSASSINECESFNEESKDRNSLLNEYKQNSKQEIINKNNEKLNHPQFFSCKNKLPSPVLNSNDKSNITSHEGQVLLDKESPMKESTKISNNYTEHLICTKPKIIEDRILKDTEQLTTNTWKRQKLGNSNYKHENSTFSEQIYSIDSKHHKTAKRANTQYRQKIKNHCTDFKSLYKLKIQSEQLTKMNSFEIPKYFDSQSIKSEINITKEPDYIGQLNTLKSIILNRRKKVLKIAKNLLTLSSYVDDTCKTILETEVQNPDIGNTDTNTNLNKKVDKSTSPCSSSEISFAITNLMQTKANSHDMYTYNPYRFKNNSHKKI